jgi:hypothetical protein
VSVTCRAEVLASGDRAVAMVQAAEHGRASNRGRTVSPRYPGSPRAVGWTTIPRFSGEVSILAWGRMMRNQRSFQGRAEGGAGALGVRGARRAQARQGAGKGANGGVLRACGPARSRACSLTS